MARQPTGRYSGVYQVVGDVPEASSPEIRVRILDEATRLFAGRGFEGTSVQAIADAVGIRKPSLLYWFESKDALRRAVLDEVLAHWKAELPHLMRAATTGKDRFASGVGALLAYFRAEPWRARLILREMLDAPDEMRGRLVEHIRPWTGLVGDYIRLGQSQGSVRADADPEAYVVEVVAMVIGTVALGEVSAAMIAPSPSVQKQLEELVRIARAALFNVRPARKG